MSSKPAQPTNSVSKPTPRAEFDLPEEDTTTALADKDRTHVVDLKTGKDVPEPVARNKDEENLILVCLDPKAKSGQAEVSSVQHTNVQACSSLLNVTLHDMETCRPLYKLLYMLRSRATGSYS
jgi:hypothetical protein